MQCEYVGPFLEDEVCNADTSDNMYKCPDGEWRYLCMDHVLVYWPTGIVPAGYFDQGDDDYDEGDDEEYDEDEDEADEGDDSDELWIS